MRKCCDTAPAVMPVDRESAPTHNLSPDSSRSIRTRLSEAIAENKRAVSAAEGGPGLRDISYLVYPTVLKCQIPLRAGLSRRLCLKQL